MPAVYHKFTVLYVHPLQLSYKEHHAVSNHQQLNCLGWDEYQIYEYEYKYEYL